MKFYEVAKYISLTSHFQDADPLLIDAKFFNSQTPEIQRALIEAAAEAKEVTRKYVDDQTEILEKELIKNGVQINNVQDIEPFRKAVEPVYKQFEKKIGKDFVDLERNIK